MSMARVVPRGHTACCDAYLTPCVKEYVKGFRAGFEGGMEGPSLLFMQSDGGLAPASNFSGHRAVLSGPAGGVVACREISRKYGKVDVVGFDMGGTSTDVCRYCDANGLEHVTECVTAGVVIQAPQLDITTVAAGGGSLLSSHGGLLMVGPESSGAMPGPVCYGRPNGKLSITDANVVLGRVVPELFPAVFGQSGSDLLDKEKAIQAFQDHIKEANLPFKSVEECALGYIAVANEAMCRPIRSITQMRGFDPSSHTLCCFGGAGPQHGCAVADALGMTRVIVPKYGGILSAYGIAVADEVVDLQEPTSGMWCPKNTAETTAKPLYIEKLEHLADNAIAHLGRGRSGKVSVSYYLHMRYHLTDSGVMVRSDSVTGDFRLARVRLEELPKSD